MAEAPDAKRAKRADEPSMGAARPPPPVCFVPTHTSWFRVDAIAELERRALPEFFDGRSSTKTADAYQHARNLIVSLYREQPGLHLSVTECRRHLATDVGAVMRLHQFLEHWGLINYNAQGAAPPTSSRNCWSLP